MENQKQPQNVSVDISQHNRGTNVETSFCDCFYEKNDVLFSGFDDFLSYALLVKELPDCVADFYISKFMSDYKFTDYEG